MAEPILLQSIFTDFILPFLLVFFIVFAILEKTKLFGDDKKQLNALTAFVIGLIFVAAVFPKQVVSNMILFLTVAIVCVFVILLIWGFIFSGEKGFVVTDWMKWGLGILAGIGFIIALIFATGFNNQLSDFFSQNLSQTVITNAVFIVVIAIALALVLMGGKAKKA
jgi:hypothetical protein